jgi:hypothetical protein
MLVRLPLVVLATLTSLSQLAYAVAPITLTFPPPPTSAHTVKSNYFGLSIELSYYNVYCAANSFNAYIILSDFDHLPSWKRQELHPPANSELL